MPGRNPKPAALLESQKGTLYGDQKERADHEPKPEIVVEPVCPFYFRPSERQAWEYLSAILKNYSLYVDINGPLLEVAAIYLAELRNSQGEIIKKGKGAKGEGKRSPAIRERNKATELLLKALSDLNISACGMAKLGAAVIRGKKEKDEFFED